ncbi:glycosyltransferase [Pseudoduganella sp. FT93W]|uniref:Glycosyltransferase n=1 Tax=Duganella fentianensis TaxID=2692177 RepID=A0A845I155_9BURK|nr:nucleotide disphospho-sugar-binding domain-containing protein [Duganella fentianensis]MYN46959.1 glycosyltransferase [Duganella fentianensis]
MPTPSPFDVAQPLVIVAASGTGGDMYPFIALGRALQQRGHQVLMLAPAFHAALVTEAGLPCQSFSTPAAFQSMLDDPALWDERRGWGVIWNGLVPYLDAMRELLRQLPAQQECVVLSHPILVPMAAIARTVRPDLRIVSAYLAPSNLCSSHDMLCAGSLPVPRWVPLGWRQALWRMIHQHMIDPVMLPGLNARRSQYGMVPVPHFFEHMFNAPDASLGLFPEWYAAPQPDWPQPFSSASFVLADAAPAAALAPELAQFLAAGDAPVLFTAGTGHQHAAEYFAAALQALQRLGRRGLLVTPHRAQLPARLPANVMWVAQAPFSALLPQVAAIVHHGGIGTLAEALRSATPQLIVPFAYDQFDNGLRARQLGVAQVLLAKRLSARGLQQRLQALLESPAVAEACRRHARALKSAGGMAVILAQVEGALFAR